MGHTQLLCNLLGQLALATGQIPLHCEDFAVLCELLAGPFSQHVGQPAILQAVLRAGVDPCLDGNTWESADWEGVSAGNAAFSDTHIGCIL